MSIYSRRELGIYAYIYICSAHMCHTVTLGLHNLDCIHVKLYNPLSIASGL
jgi:DMSO/TMAO reductase YedYZ heme-binding membrane subunit